MKQISSRLRRGQLSNFSKQSFRKVISTEIYIHARGVLGAFPVNTKTKSHDKFLNHIRESGQI